MAIRVPGGAVHSVVAFAVFGVDWEFFKPYIVLGLALGGVYALSGVGIVVLYQATGVLNLAFGAIGACGALIAYWMLNHTSWPHWLAYVTCVAFGGVVNLAYGLIFGPAFAARDPLVKMMGTLGLALILLGLMAWRAPVGGAFARFLPLPSSSHTFTLFGAFVNWTQVIAFAFAFALTVVTTLFLRYTNLGTAYRAIANDREITATLGVPVRRVEASAWFGSGLVARRGRPAPAGPDHVARLRRTDLPRDRSARCRADRAAPVALGDLPGGLAVGLAQAIFAPYASLDALPLGRAVRARDRRAALALSSPRRDDLAGGALDVGGDADTGERAGAATRAARARPGDDRSRRRDRRVSRDRALRAPDASAPTGRRRSRASRSTR